MRIRARLLRLLVLDAALINTLVLWQSNFQLEGISTRQLFWLLLHSLYP